jgi:phosphate/sulfate permease
MATARGVLDPEEYTNYRNVRAAAVLFVVIGSILVLGGIGAATEKKPDPNRDIPPAAAIGIAIIGLAGAVGALNALLGNRRWAKLVYVMAVPWLLFPLLGTVMSYVVLSGLSRYLDSKDRLKEATMGGA